MFEPETPWPMPLASDCIFYHSFDLPDGKQITGHWDFRNRFDQYVGNYPLAGKTVLDVGTATGFLAFSAEQRGAKVTAFEAKHASDLSRVPFRDTHYQRDRAAWARDYNETQHKPLQRGYWYAWHKLGSRTETIYDSLSNFPFWERRFDVVMAGAILEHLSDPVSAIGAMAHLAKEAVIIAFTPVAATNELCMYAAGWTEPRHDFAWFTLSRGLYKRVFENLGFEIEIVHCSAIYNPNVHNDLSIPVEHTRPTIIARRSR